MITLRKAAARGKSQTFWLDSFHTFSFDRYYDPLFMHFSELRVINEDYVRAGQGFGRHPHKNMEIITYVVEGALEHKDSLGTGSIIKPGEIQRMTAGSGVEHSEFNHSSSDDLHLLQIWILPATQNLTPSYEQKTIPAALNTLTQIGSQSGGGNAVTIHQDVNLYVAKLELGCTITHPVQAHRKLWMQLIKGDVEVNGLTMSEGDGAAVSDETALNFVCTAQAEFLLFDLP
jgi:redox-sensitive bicupin YhaK (pirin superfamily)